MRGSGVSMAFLPVDEVMGFTVATREGLGRAPG